MYATYVLSLLTLALPQAQAERVDSRRSADPIANHFPADTLALAEFSLEPWDRLRAGMRAHEIFRGRNVLKSALDSSGLPAEVGMSRDRLRDVMGSVRVAVGVAGSSVPPGCALVAVEPVGLGASGVDHARWIGALSGAQPRAIGPGWFLVVPILPEAEPAPEAIEACLDRLAEAGESDRLGADALWTSARRGEVGRDDLARVTVLTGNWTVASLIHFLEPVTDPSSARVIRTFAEIPLLAEPPVRAMTAVSRIVGDGVVERMVFHPDPAWASALMVEADPRAMLARLAEQPGAYGSVAVAHMNLPVFLTRMVEMMEAVYDGVMSDFEPGPLPNRGGEQSEFEEVLTAFRTLGTFFGDEVLTGVVALPESFGDYGRMTYQVEVTDSEGLRAQWEQLQERWPELALAEGLGAVSGVSAGLEDGAFTVHYGAPVADETRFGDHPDFAAVRERVLTRIDGVPCSGVGVTRARLERVELRRVIERAAESFDISVGVPVDDAALEAIETGWSVSLIEGDRFVQETHSTVGFMLSGFVGLALDLRAQLRGAPAVPDLDEEEF